ncbi:MAG: GAF domain-containing protein, partial [Bdellovibrionales bacterium]|nr:GAF domain-containing protein [Bdellovibrionales bacterium]
MDNGVGSSIKLAEIEELFLSIEDADIRISEGLSLVKESEGFDFASLILIAPESVAPRTQESRSFKAPKATVFSISSQSLQPRWFSADFFLSGDGAIVFQGEPITIPFFSPRIRAASAHNGLLALLDKEGVSSVGLLPVKEKGVLLGVLIVGYFGNHHFWRQAQRGFLLNFAELLGRHLCQKTPTIDGVSPGVAVGSQVPSEITGPTVSTEIQPKEVSRDEQKAVPPSRAEAIPTPGAVRNAGATRTVSEADVPHQAEFQRLLQYGQLILLKTDTNFRLTEIIGSSEKLFGFTKQELFGRENIWERFFDPLDLRRLALRLRRMGKRAHEFGEEIRYTRRGEDKPRWLLLKAAPVLDDAGVCIGWEGFGVDITERRLVELQLRAQRQRTEALYEVSRALRVNLDPALVTLKGLNALIRATGSDAGLCCFYDEVEGTIEMVAAEGLSQRYLDGIAGIVDGPNLVRYTVEQKKGILLDNVQEDSRAATDLARLEDLKSTVLMPLMSGGKVLGALVIFSREAGRYGREDFHLVAAAASQISFAARQAEFYTAEKAEADSLAVLYRLSHEISRLFRGAEIGEHVFSIIQQEFACKRLWFGILNNQATHIMGQAGFGPGIRQQVKEVQVELGLRHDFLDEAIRTKKPVLVNAGTPMECSGLNRLFQKLKPGTFVILPLVSLGQVVGVIVAEPVIGSPEYVNKKLSLLMRM